MTESGMVAMIVASGVPRPSRRGRRVAPLIVAAWTGGGVLAAGVPADFPAIARSGGATTVMAEGRNAFAMPLANLSRETRRAHVVGNSFFNQNWVVAPSSTTARDGLGPHFQARSCSGCHFKDGRGRPPGEGESMVSMVLRLSVPGRDTGGGPLPHPVYGGQLNEHAIPGVTVEGTTSIRYGKIEGAYPDGTPYALRKPEYRIAWGSDPAGEDLMVSPRVAPPVHGLGLLEAVAEADVLAHADPEDTDGDGISGRPNRVWDVVAGTVALGRFGWKAEQPGIRQQTAGAFVGDIGITSSLFPDENHSAAQAAAMPVLPVAGGPEIDDRLLDRVVTYVRTLAPPARRDFDDPVVGRGEAHFTALGCARCHVPELQTADEASLSELAGQTIRPFTDLLLHDMGDGLADGRPAFEADGREWRTPPLWGIGLVETVNGHTLLLHDGRARGFEEAILWHGGEAEAARLAFMALPAEERAAVIRFLESL